MKANNNAKLREVVELVAHINDDGYWSGSASICNLAAKARAALAEPPRNCDKFTESDKALTKFMVENPNELMDKQTIWKFSEWLYASK